MRKNIKTLFIATSLFLIPFILTAQKTEIKKSDDLKQALENYHSKNYSLSLEQFTSYIEKNKANNTLSLEDAYFFQASCAYELMNNDTDKLLLDFINNFQESHRVNDAKFLLANHYMRNQQFEKAESIYSQINIKSLPQSTKYEYYYKQGHCQFMQKNYEKAKTSFKHVKDARSKYAVAATYFYGHILYEEGEYNKALKEFLPLRNEKNFGKIVPYYIAQIYYNEKKYEELIAIASELSNNSKSKNSSELNKMLGDAYYKLGRYSEAIPYLEKSVQAPNVATSQDYYLLGFTLLEEKQYERAKTYLEKAGDNNDSLSQNALYHLGICYLQLNDKISAKSMFKEAYKYDFDNKIKEKALLNFAKLSYETNAAFNESIKAFQTYIELFPKSKNANEAKEYLAQLYGNTQNYRDAIEMIEQMTERNKTINQAYQKICLNRAIECFNENKLDEAIIYLDKSLSQSHSNEITAIAYYLKGESYYQLENYNLSINNLKKFFETPGSKSNIYHNQANYTMGYNLFKQKKYNQALKYFKACEESKNETINIDAKCRYADCLYMGKDFQNAIKEYDYVISKNKLDADYASYQKGMAYGALGNYDRKISILESALSQFSKSNYVASMMYELANSYLTLDLYPKSLELYNKITTSYPQSIHAKDSYAKIGMIYYNMGKEKEALTHLKQVVEKYPGTEEAKSALNNIKTIYIEANNVDEFIAYTKRIPEAEITQSEQDSISYQAIENQYMNGDCQRAISGFKDYIAKYPDGAFFVSANYYLADCLIKNSQKQEALQAYENIIQKPKNSFTEKAILKAAGLNFEAKNYETALAEYCLLEQTAEISNHKLQALVGAMECYYLLDKFDSTIIASNKVLALEKTDENTSETATYYLAKSLLKGSNSGQAIEEFRKLTKAKNTEYASEAQYTLAEIQYNNGNLDESEKTILEITSNPSSEYWLAKAFILWSDIFKQRGNKIQAKQTLQSIIDNYEGDDSIITEAQNKLNEINNKHSEEQKLQEQKLQEQKEAVDEVIIENK